MNLFDMIRRNDRNLELFGDVVQTKREFAGRTYRALRLSRGSGVRIRTPRRFLPFSRLPASIGWSAASESAPSTLCVTYQNAQRAALLSQPLGQLPVEVAFPLPRSSQVEPDGATLELRADKGACFLLINEVMDRGELIAMCRGTGIEIGPGHQPQIRPNEFVDVRYVEEKGAESWLGTYDSKDALAVDRSLWSRYVIGNAASIPTEDVSLDFIFSSHVLEHLINPLKCLEHWSHKLKPGGIVACVVPDAMGCKDYVFALSDPAQWEAEYDQSVATVSREHFVRYVQGRGMPPEQVERMIATGFSIHVHFYSRENILFLLSSCVSRGWFSEYSLDFRPNNKDFYVVLRKASEPISAWTL